ncbi:MAG: peptidyl-prolyl cis-trans isomerase [Gemmatimonadaceae bacterium]|nr:peptidyl-prolyl cis-trans isomerase [Acetobacteraceae bacterium]
MPDTNAVPTPDLATTRASRPAWWRGLLHEPLVHFMALGGLLFAASAVLAPAQDTSRVIAVTPAVRAEITALYAGTHGRPPNEAELAPLIENWVRTQILYREALALGLDKGDEMIRERITHKMNLLVFSSLRVPVPTDDELRAYLEANRAAYDQPARYDFLGLLVEPGLTREQAEAQAQALSDEENDPPADLVGRVRAYANRDRAGIAALFGTAFADTLAGMAQDTWRAVPINPSAGAEWLVTRVARMHPPRAADFDTIKPNLVDPWQTAAARALAQKAVADMGARYTILNGPAP